MAKKNQRLLTMLGSAIGTGLAVIGIRQGVRWFQRRQMTNRYPESSDWHGSRYQPVDQPDLGAIPTTGTTVTSGPMAPAPVMDESEQTGDYVFDREPGGSQPAMQAQDVGNPVTGQQQDIVMDDYVAPLIEHAIAFHSVMNLLRSRQRDGAGNEGVESLTEGDRNSMRAVLDQMQEHIAQHDVATLRKTPLAERSYKLTQKLRDALDNLDYSGSDLFRIHGEVSKDLCKLVRELETSGRVTITGLDHIRQLYDCQ